VTSGGHFWVSGLKTQVWRKMSTFWPGDSAASQKPTDDALWLIHSSKKSLPVGFSPRMALTKYPSPSL